MTGISGWVGALDASRAPDEIIKKMSSRLSRGEHDCHFLENTKKNAAIGGALSLVSRYDFNDVAEDDDFIATICGKVIWQNPMLKSFAEEFGDERALIEGYKDITAMS